MMYQLSTTIKKKWMDKILSGEKKTELKGSTEYWDTRMQKAVSALKEGDIVKINFLCGRQYYRYKVNYIRFCEGQWTIDDKQFNQWWEVSLGMKLGHDGGIKATFDSAKIINTIQYEDAAGKVTFCMVGGINEELGYRFSPMFRELWDIQEAREVLEKYGLEKRG